MDDEDAVDNEDVDVEFYYDDDVVDDYEHQDADSRISEKEDMEETKAAEKEEGSGLVVTEEV